MFHITSGYSIHQTPRDLARVHPTLSCTRVGTRGPLESTILGRFLYPAALERSEQAQKPAFDGSCATINCALPGAPAAVIANDPVVAVAVTVTVLVLA